MIALLTVNITVDKCMFNSRWQLWSPRGSALKFYLICAVSLMGCLQELYYAFLVHMQHDDLFLGLHAVRIQDFDAGAVPPKEKPTSRKLGSLCHP
jgi:hypothetical protein